MNETTMLRLEYDQIKTRVSECAFSYLGKQHAASMQPITDIRTIKIRLNETSEAYSSFATELAYLFLHWKEWSTFCTSWELAICSASVIFLIWPNSSEAACS